MGSMSNFSASLFTVRRRTFVNNYDKSTIVCNINIELELQQEKE